MMLVDQAERDQVVRHPVARLLVEAGAGTGKTTLMVERALRAILHEGVKLRRVVLITFMDKAAAEIIERLEGRLQEVRQTARGEELARVERALRDLPGARIGTIHAFCRRILSDYALEAAIPLQFTVLDAHETERLWQQTFHQWIAQGETARRLEPLWAMGLSVPTLAEWAQQVGRWTSIPPLPPAPALDWGAFVARFESRVRAAWERARRDAPPTDGGYQQAEEIAHQFELLGHMPGTEWPRLIGYWNPSLAARGNKKNWGHPAWLAEQKMLVAELKEALTEIRQRLAERLLREWLDLMVTDFLPKWRQVRWDQGALTFDDLLGETLRLLQTRPEVAAQIADGVDLLMVDEFQDTDPVQVAIILRLAEAGIAQLFLVGDPKQSIYRFRGADAETYAEVRRAMPQVVAIRQNFRSTPSIIDVVNRVFASRFLEQPDPERPYVPPYARLESAFPPDRRVRVMVDGGPVEGDAMSRRRHEAGLAASLIAKAIAERWPVRAGDGERPLTYQDIVLLVPARTELEVYRETLRTAGIPLTSQSGRDFFRRDEVRGFQSLLAALRDPDNQVEVVAWLTSAWVGLTADDLAAYRLENGCFDYRNRINSVSPVSQWLGWMAAWRKDFIKRWPEEIFWEALRVTGLRRVLEDREDQAALANLEKLGDLARRLGVAWGIGEFTRWLSRKVQEAESEEEGEVKTPGGAVHLSTVHQAKGLEWPMVIVANWGRKASRPPAWLVDRRSGRVALGTSPWLSRDWETLRRDWIVRETAEADRLLYVALTRARDYLTVLETFDAKSDSTGNLWMLDGAVRIAEIGERNRGSATPSPPTARLPIPQTSVDHGEWRAWPPRTPPPSDPERANEAVQLARQWMREPETRPDVFQGCHSIETNVPVYYHGRRMVADVWVVLADGTAHAVVLDRDRGDDLRRRVATLADGLSAAGIAGQLWVYGTHNRKLTHARTVKVSQASRNV